MSPVELVPADESHIPSIAARMRPIDQLEARAFGHEPAQALWLAMKASVDCFTGLVDGEPEAMLGLAPRSLVEGRGSPWLLGTERIFQIPRAMLVLGRRVLDLWGDSTPRMEGLVAVENAPAIRLLRRWGFMVGETTVTVGGVEFLRFEREA